MADKLVVECEEYDRYRIYWWLEEDDDLGGAVGDYDASAAKREELLEKIRSSEVPHEDDVASLECAVADLAARATPNVKKDSMGYHWETKAQAAQAIREVKTALKLVRIEMKTGRREPDWAIKARAAGWKPPKNWKP